MRLERTTWIKSLALIGLGIVVGGLIPGQPVTNARESTRIEPVRIAYVNIPKVLRHFERANAEGAKISQQREAYVNQVKTERAALENLTDQYQATDDEQILKTLQEQALATQKRIEAIDKEAQQQLTERSNGTIVEVYTQIRSVIEALAKDRGLDVIEAFPAPTVPEEERSPQVAQLMLQSPALMPFYVKRELDLTDEVIERLNKKYPAQP